MNVTVPFKAVLAPITALSVEKSGKGKQLPPAGKEKQLAVYAHLEA
ncbi:hypothetical protein [Paenibacillus lutrae]|nr:hypothetical protein [Paenibacillus lutrae]